MPEMTVVDGLEMRFEVHGDGIPVAYTPGAFYRLESARPVAEALVPLGYQVLLWDRPNTGGSGLSFSGENLLWLWADTLHRLLDQVGLRPAYVAGVANGLLASLHFARRYPEDVKALVLIAALTNDRAWWQPVIEATFLWPASVIEEEGMAAALDLNGGRWGVFDWPEQFELVPQKRQQLLETNPATAAATLRAWAHGYSTPGRLAFGGLTDDDLAAIEKPAVVFSGADEHHTVEHARMLQHALPRSELVNSAEYHGSAWQDIVNEAEVKNSFEYLAATMAGRIDTFIRVLEERAGEPNLW
jgi:pimeloyl-ACP methyl ester carboxylesterase